MALRVIFLFAFLRYAHSQLLTQSCQQIKTFMDGHNIRRENLTRGFVSDQPMAAEMKYMIWDEELAAKAALWASELRYEHNPDRTIPSGRFDTGENLYWYSTSDFNYQLSPESANEGWFNEHYDYTYGPMTAEQFSSSKQIGHYTQMAWANTFYLGCAISQWSDNGWNTFFVVCNYGPPGNWFGQEPYVASSSQGVVMCAAGDCSRPYGDQC